MLETLLVPLRIFQAFLNLLGGVLGLETLYIPER